MRVLVIDDHAEVRGLLQRALVRDGHIVEVCGDLAAARAFLGGGDADVVVLDLGLPDGDGLDLCRDLRRLGRGVPILLLTAQARVSRRVEGFDAGADDFLAKPFAVAELRARVRALGRRGALPRGPIHRHGRVELDLAARRASRDGREVPLTAREWAVVDVLMRRDGRLVPRAELLELAWGDAAEGARASLDVIVGRIRHKLGDEVIRTVRGEGYALAGP